MFFSKIDRCARLQIVKQKFDVVVIGSGPGGYPAAIRAAQRGKRVALIEAGLWGGTCLNYGCIPSKALIACAEMVERMGHASSFGIQTSPITFDYAAMVARKDQLVEQIRKSLEKLLQGYATLIQGHATFTGKKTLSITGKTPMEIEADSIIIATGSTPRNLSAFPFDEEYILDSTALLNRKTLPKSIAIVGGGVIGCEFASLYSLLGVKVTLIEMLPSLLPMECTAVSQALTRAFKKRGITIETGTKLEKIEKSASGVELTLQDKKLTAEIALVAVGREMHLSALNLEKTGIIQKRPDRIEVNSQMETSVKGIFAVGDIASPWWLAHVATHQGLVAADNASGHPAHMDYSSVPNVIFTHPEIATVGLCPEKAKEKYPQAKTVIFPLQILGKAQAMGQTEGFTQLVVEPTHGQILGAQIVGHGASMLISEMVIALRNELTLECLYESIHPHPTFGESWMEAALMAANLPLHTPP